LGSADKGVENRKFKMSPGWYGLHCARTEKHSQDLKDLIEASASLGV